MNIPGNCIEFSLETSTFYAKDVHSNHFGFKCLVVGFDNPAEIDMRNSSLMSLEQELAYLGGMCSANLMKRDLTLPDDKDIEVLASVEDTIRTHHSLLSKGYELAQPVLTIHQALEPSLPIGSQSNERQFLDDFIRASPASSGARLASWLQPESRLDPNKCQLNAIHEPVRYGWPTTVSVNIRDQYGDPVLVPDLVVEIKAIPTGSNSNDSNVTLPLTDHISQNDNQVPRFSYEPTLRDKMCFRAITFMKPFSNFSFEELRFSSPIQTRATEILVAQDMEDGSFSVHWTPNSVGHYCLTVIIDGIILEEVYRVEVKEGSLPPPSYKHKKTQPANKLRRFNAPFSSGLRIRSHPNLQSEQVGVIKLNGIISFIDELLNDDGIWLRLSTESIRQHCTTGRFPTEAWCLQFNQHTAKTLLYPVVTSEINNEFPTSNVAGTVKIMNKSNNNNPIKNDVTLSLFNADLGISFKNILDDAQASIKYEDFSESPKNSLHAQTSEKLDKECELGVSFDILPCSPREGSVTSSSSTNQEPIRSSNATNLGSAIAGVMGGGASKLQALQKWFKGDSVEGSATGTNQNYQLDCDDSNEIPTESSLHSCSTIKSTFGNTNILDNISTNYSKLSCNDNNDDAISVELAKCATENFDVSMIRKTNFTPTQTTALLSSPKHAPRKSKINQRANSADVSRVSNCTGLADGHSVVENNTDAANTTSGITTIEKPTSSVEAKHLSSSEQTRKNKLIGPIKRAMLPSLAESIRSVFAAFLWHEGLVHDAMTCASFLKFHPLIPKEGSTVVTRSDGKCHLSRKQKSLHRHSVEVSNAGNYLNIRPSTLESLNASGNFSLTPRKGFTSNSRDTGSVNEEKRKLHLLPEVVTVLPPALRCLVYLWELICIHCIEVVQVKNLEPQKAQTSLCDLNGDYSHDKINMLEGGPFESQKSHNKKKEDNSWCEICESILTIPVIYHMRLQYPGCGNAANGKGYNSVGTYCEGWAGNCGEGGKGASSWYLLCDVCREKYMKTNMKNVLNVNNVKDCTNHSTNESSLLAERKSSLIYNSEVYKRMRENAKFLLELSSSSSDFPASLANGGPAVLRTRSPQKNTVFIENKNFKTNDFNNKPSTNQCAGNSKVSQRMDGPKYLVEHCQTPASNSYGVYNNWRAPDSFAYLECLGLLHSEEMPYEMLGCQNSDNRYGRPLSEASYEPCQPHTSELVGGSFGLSGRITSRVHRSYSMGQGWTLPNDLQEEEEYQNQDESKIHAKGNNNQSEKDVTLLMCYPSEHLRKLVPEHIFNSSLAFTGPKKTLVSHSKQEIEGQFNTNLVRFPPDVVSTAGHPIDDEGKAQLSMLINRPAILFMIQKHDLSNLRYALKRCLRIATCRIYSLQAINWLLRSVTQSVCLHDLMWWFVGSLRTSSLDLVDVKYEEHEPALEHPVSFTQISGKLSHMISLSLHEFLQSVADLTLYFPMGSPLQRAAIQCFGMKFCAADHQFLHCSHVFANISKILSKSDEDNDVLIGSVKHNAETELDMHGAELNYQTFPPLFHGAGASLLYYSDLQGMFQITVSSRQCMADSLTDNSTETFWESDEEDRNKWKVIEISMIKHTYVCHMIFVHIDNSRDVQNKVSNVLIYAGQSLGETNLIKSVNVDEKACTWIVARVTDNNTTNFRLEFNGPENTLRVRQIKLLGLPRALIDLDVELQEENYNAPRYKANLKMMHACRIKQQLCESETLRVFRLITGQVFGKLITAALANEDQRSKDIKQSFNSEGCSINSLLPDSLDLREHMVGILFSRSKLSHLQKQVIVHIVQAIRKEAEHAREAWEITNLSNCLRDSHGMSTSLGDSKSECSSDRSRVPDIYCFEMLSMVLALSGSVVGRSYLSQQHGLLKDLFTLLHTGSDRVQRQVIALLRRMLPDITPEKFAELMGVPRLPPADYIAHEASNDFDINRLGLLDSLLAIIAKSLQLQIKTKNYMKPGTEKFPGFIRLCHSLDLSVYSLVENAKLLSGTETEKYKDSNFCLDRFGTDQRSSLDRFIDFRKSKTCKWPGRAEVKKNLNQRWFLNGTISTKQSQNIISLIRDLTHGKLGRKWSQMTKAAIAEAVLNLTRMDELFRVPENCIKTATLWLALASLCVLDSDHVEKLSSGQWSKLSDTRPVCTNHDDGETPAIIQCDTCGVLCADCDRFLHLNRKMRLHKRTVCKEEEEAIRVELHESCGRTKLFWLLALADSKTLKALVEFRCGSKSIVTGLQDTVGRCRFCGVTGNSGLLEIGNVCSDAQCQSHATNSCMKTKPCGHLCGGVAKEQKCLPCLQNVCHARENELAEEMHEPKLTQDADDMCMICFVEALSCAPSIHLVCGHVFHYHCTKIVLERRWNGPRITFGFSLCPICKADIHHPLLLEMLRPIIAIKEDVKKKSLMRLKYEGVVKEPEIHDAQQAMERYAYYVCFKCQKAYYGGEARCDVEIGEKFDPAELVCGGCSDVTRAQMCSKHGTDFLEYKCRYCCSVAVFFCFGTTHFCDTCHDDFQRLTNIPKNKLPQCPAGPQAKQLMGDECPLHIVHPPTGEEFALGCGVCRNAQTF